MKKILANKKKILISDRKNNFKFIFSFFINRIAIKKVQKKKKISLLI
jgi:hypothetical protein